MKLMKQLILLQRIDNLIRRKATGTPDELARKLGLSRASVFRQIEILKDLGALISYSKTRGSYYYEETFFFQIGKVSNFET